MAATIKDVVHETIHDNPAIPEDQKAKYEELFLKIFEQEMLPKDAMGLSENVMESIYSFGYQLHKTGKFKEAAEIFKYLLQLDPSKTKYAIALGSCFQYLSRWQDAMGAYMEANLMDPDDPYPLTQIAECFIKLNCPKWALVCYKNAIERAEGISGYDQLKQRCLLMIDSLEKKE